MDSLTLLKETEEWHQKEADKLEARYEKRWKPVIDKILQKFANDTGYEVKILSGNGACFVEAIDEKNNTRYSVKKYDGYDPRNNPSISNFYVESEPIDEAMGFDDPIQDIIEKYLDFDGPNAYGLQEEEEENWHKKFEPLAHIKALMEDSQYINGMGFWDFDIKPNKG